MYKHIVDIISSLDTKEIAAERKEVLVLLKEFVKTRLSTSGEVALLFICTHNSRRSHLAQVWAHVMAHFHGHHGVSTYSGGTEATAIFSQTLEALMAQGFAAIKLSEGSNPVWALRCDEHAAPIICFSKAMDHAYNPTNGFGAIMTCDSADEACPFVPGASGRFPIRYMDPKSSDGTERMVQTYHERSLEIAREMKFIFERDPLL